MSLLGHPEESLIIPVSLSAREANLLVDVITRLGPEANYYDQTPLCFRRDEILSGLRLSWPDKDPSVGVVITPDETFLSRGRHEYEEMLRLKAERAAERRAEEARRSREACSPEARAKRRREEIKERESEILTKKILLDLLTGNYKVTFAAPNCVFEYHHPDGSPFYEVRNMDDAKTSTDAGSCTVTVQGQAFTCDLNTGKWEYGGEYDLLDDSELIEALEGADGVISGEHTCADDMIIIYETAYNCECEEYYYCGDCDMPVDVEDMIRLADCEFTRCGDYYLLEDINDADADHDGRRWARAALDAPDNYGKYPCVTFLFDDHGNKVGEMPCEDIFDPDYGEFE